MDSMTDIIDESLALQDPSMDGEEMDTCPDPIFIRSLRQRLCLGTQDLADLLGVSRTTIVRWESGVQPVSTARRDACERLAQIDATVRDIVHQRYTQDDDDTPICLPVCADWVMVIPCIADQILHQCTATRLPGDWYRGVIAEAAFDAQSMDRPHRRIQEYMESGTVILDLSSSPMGDRSI